MTKREAMEAHLAKATETGIDFPTPSPMSVETRSAIVQAHALAALAYALALTHENAEHQEPAGIPADYADSAE